MLAERACPRPPWIENPYRLVSLGEIVERFNVAMYTRTVEPIGGILALAEATVRGELLLDPNSPLQKDGGSEKLRVLAHELEAIIRPLGFAIAMDSVWKMQAIAADPQSTMGHSTKAIEEFVGRLHAHLDNTTFLYVPFEQVALYEADRLFGDDVPTAFPSTQRDIAEAGKCLALDRFTACVFHLTRVLQVGLYALAKDLSIDPAGRNWGVVIGEMEKEIKARRAVRQDTQFREDWLADNKFYAGAAMQFDHIVTAFRNDAVHKTGEMFMPDEARTVYTHSRDFMQQLATRLAE